jgi:hypothetical protein
MALRFEELEEFLADFGGFHSVLWGRSWLEPTAAKH